mmetsp:Transcript_52346/g.59833  ORF Transcript_52346/g.59833 Transcript_52346/m.59833 type:complete len:370 (-) Transcript_52346:18-1127(-)
MAQSDGSSLRVQFFTGNVQFFDTVGGLTGESFVNFEDINIVHSEAGLFQSGGDGSSGSDTHDFWGDTLDGVGSESSQRLEAQFTSGGSGHQDATSSTISNLTGVTGSGTSSLSEGGLQFSQRLHGSTSSDTFILGDSDGLGVTFLVDNGGFDGDDFIIEETGILSLGSLSVRFNGHLVLNFSGNAEFFSNILGGHTHGQQTVSGFFVFENGFAQQVRIDNRVHITSGHAFNTSTNTDLNISGFDGRSNLSNGFETTGAKPVGDLEGSSVGETSQELTHSGVDVTRSDNQSVTDANIFNIAALKSTSLQQLLEDNGEQVFISSVLETTSLSLGQGSSGIGNNDDVFVGLSSGSSASRHQMVLDQFESVHL